MLTSPPFAFFCIALICSLYSVYWDRRIHSAQKEIEFNHSRAKWDFQADLYARHVQFLRENRTFGLASGWLAACFAAECLFGHHFNWGRLDYLFVAGGSFAGIAAGYLIRHHELFDRRTVTSASAIFVPCILYGLRWELGAVSLPLAIVGWYFSQPNEP